MRIHVLLFGVLKDIVGQSDEILELHEQSRIDDLLASYRSRFPQLDSLLPTLAIAVNQEYSQADQPLRAGDEVALLPPVSGGSTDAHKGADDSQKQVLHSPTPGHIRVVREPIDLASEVSHIKRSSDGAEVIFEGIVRDNTRGRRTLYLDYEAYESMALKEMTLLAEQSQQRFPISAVSIIHRLGRLEIGETSVLIVVASPHRAAGFEACRWIIDTLKKTVPIWKKEYFEDGAVWADGEPFPEEIQPHAPVSGNKTASN